MNVFLSHSSADRKYAESLQRILRAKFHTDSGQSEFSFAPTLNEIDPGENWLLEAGKALDEAEAMVVLISPASVKSDSVRKEIEFALTRPQFRNRIFPVVVKPTREMPWILSRMPLIKADSDSEITAKSLAKVLRKSAEAR